MASREDVYAAFVDYYGDIKLKVVKQEGGGQWTILAAKCQSYLNLNRYIFVVVPTRLVRAETMSLNELDWVSFQTRSIEESYPGVPTLQLHLTDERKKMLPERITVVDRDRDTTFYITDTLPIKIRLLHDPKKNNYLQYPDKAILFQALETFRCVVDLL